MSYCAGTVRLCPARIAAERLAADQASAGWSTLTTTPLTESAVGRVGLEPTTDGL